MKTDKRTYKARLAKRFARRLRVLCRSNRGAISVELALVTPLLLLMMLTFTDLYLYMRAQSSVEHTAFTLADSIGQMSQVVNTTATDSPTNLGAIWAAAALLSAPNTLNTGYGGVVITSICDSTSSTCNAPSTAMTSGTAKLYWQAKAPWNSNYATTQETSTNLLPSTWPFRTGDAAIVVEVFYTFNPFAMLKVFWSGAPGQQTIYQRVYTRPRGTSSGAALALVASS